MAEQLLCRDIERETRACSGMRAVDVETLGGLSETSSELYLGGSLFEVSHENRWNLGPGVIVLIDGLLDR